MTSFVHPSLLAWPLLMMIGIPILIHLINMLRHRRVQWAAMEFLLVSQKKNRRWIWLKQLLLLLMRMAAVALVLLMVSQWVLTGSWSRIFGGSTTHHILLVDDSYSMSATSGGGSDFDHAIQVAERLAGRIAGEESSQKFTLLTFSQAVRADWDPDNDLIAVAVGNRRLFGQRVEEVCQNLEVTQLSIGPTAALEGLGHLLRDNTASNTASENRVIHLVTDFREREWKDATDLKQRLSDLAGAGVQLHLINCTAAAESNLAESNLAESNLTVTALAPEPGVRAAGVPLMMSVSVKNHGSTTVSNVVVGIETSRPPLLSGGGVSDRTTDDWTKLPAVRIDEITSGQTITKRFQTQFTTAGSHVLRASLEGDYLTRADSVRIDNTRYSVVDVLLEVPLLLIDGDPKDDDASFISTAMRPGGAVRTGLNPIVKSPSFLRDQPLSGHGVIYLLNIGRLDGSAIESLESYARGGGGVIFFMGPNTDRRFVNTRLYRAGQGLFPLPLLGPTDLLVDAIESSADVIIDEKSILGRLTSPLYQTSAVRINRYLRAEANWQPDPKSSTQIIAHLRSGAPLIVQHRFGKGSVVAVLTTAGREWTNWPTVMTYPIMLQELQGTMLSAGAAMADGLVGAPITLTVDSQPSQDGSNITVRTPRPALAPLHTIGRPIEAADDGTHHITLGKENARATDVAGIYGFPLTTADGKLQLTRIARNVSPDEGSLATLDSRQLATQLKGVDYIYHGFADIQSPSRKLAGYNSGPLLLALLLALLICEQIMAFIASYHPPRVEVAS